MLAYYRAYGPEGTPLEELVRVAGSRWIVEESFKRAEGADGIDEYEVRCWEARYRYITLAHAYLEVPRLYANVAEEVGGKGPAEGLVPLTMPEVRRLLIALNEPEGRFRVRMAGPAGDDGIKPVRNSATRRDEPADMRSPATAPI